MDDSLNGTGIRVGIIKAKWNSTVVEALVDGCIQTLREHGVTQITIEMVGGAFELPLASQAIAKSGQFDAIVPVGCLIKGETLHFEYISGASVDGLMRVGLDTHIPVVNGILNVMNGSQALARAGLQGTHGNEGIGWAKTAIQQALLVRKYRL